MGISTALELNQRAMSELYANFTGVEIIMDDILVHAPTLENHNQRLDAVLQNAREVNLKLNPRKNKLCSHSVNYVGNVLTQDGVKIDPE